MPDNRRPWSWPQFAMAVGLLPVSFLLTVTDFGEGRRNGQATRGQQQANGHDPPLRNTVQDGGGPWPLLHGACPAVVLRSACPSAKTSTTASSTPPSTFDSGWTKPSTTGPNCSP